MRYCERCGTLFELKDPRGRFCSIRCSSRKEWPPPSKTCEQCGKVYFKHEVAVGNYKLWEKRRFCSKRCYGDALRREMVACAYCGNRFHPVITRATVFCSQRCYHDARAARKDQPQHRLTQQRLRDGHNFTPSQRKQLRRLAEDRCQKCGATENLEIDHIVPVYLGGTNDLTNGQVLCRSCHNAKTNDEYWSRLGAT